MRYRCKDMPDDMLLDSDVNRLLKLLCSVDVEVWSASSYVNKYRSRDKVITSGVQTEL